MRVIWIYNWIIWGNFKLVVSGFHNLTFLSPPLVRLVCMTRSIFGNHSKHFSISYFCLPGPVTPVASIVMKYSSEGGFKKRHLKNLPNKVSTIIAEAANYSVAKNTWRSYSTARQHILKAGKWANVKMSIPFTLEMTLTYVAYLRGKSKPCKSDTIGKYLSGLRMVHLEMGHNPVFLRANMVKQVLSGAAQMDILKEKIEGRPERLAVTVPVLKLLKQAIKCESWNQSKKRLVWAVSAMAFGGSFRIHKLLSRESGKFDPSQTLLGRDVSLMEMEPEGEMEIIVVHIKSPKEQKLAKGIKVEVFPCPGTGFCPVSAYKKWRHVSRIKLDRSKPMFRLDSGKCYTGQSFNKDLRTLLREVKKKKKKKKK